MVVSDGWEEMAESLDCCGGKEGELWDEEVGELSCGAGFVDMLLLLQLCVCIVDEEVIGESSV